MCGKLRFCFGRVNNWWKFFSDSEAWHWDLKFFIFLINLSLIQKQFYQLFGTALGLMRFRAFDEKGTGFWTQLEYVANLWGISLQQPAQVMLINPRGCSAAWVWNSSKQRHFFKFSGQIQSTLSMLNKNWYVLVLPSDMFSEWSLSDLIAQHSSINQ